jgi:putative transposase
MDDGSTPPPRRTMHRVEQPGHARFLTFSCYQRLPLLDHEGIRELFVERLRIACDGGRIPLLGWVVMPEHVHLMLFPDSQPPDVRRFTHALKRPFAEAVIRRWKQLGAPILEKITYAAGYRYWQAGGGYDRNVFDPQQVREKIEYMHDNPVRRGIVKYAIDYPWSSARWYARFPDAKIVCGELPW